MHTTGDFRSDEELDEQLLAAFSMIAELKLELHEMDNRLWQLGLALERIDQLRERFTSS